MAQLIKLEGSTWQEEFADGSQSSSLSIQEFNDILAAAGLSATSAVGPRWHIDSFGRHRFTEWNDLIDESESSGLWLGDQIEAVAGVGFSVVIHRFAPAPVPPDNRFWTGLQLAVEIP